MRRLKLGLALGAGGAFVALSLVSYSPEDPSFNTVVLPPASVHNLGGVVGSYLADLLLQGWGLAAFCFPLGLLLGSWACLRGWRGGLSPARAACLLAACACLCGLGEMAWGEVEAWGQPLHAGGMVGYLLGRASVSLFGPTGATLALGTLLVLCLLGALERPLGRAARPRLRPRRRSPSSEASGTNPPELPSPELLSPPERPHPPSREELAQRASLLEDRLQRFGVAGRVIGVRPGPVITCYDFEPAPGVRIGRILGLADDLALSLKTVGVRIEAPLPGKGAVGIEIPNEVRERVSFRELVTSEEFRRSTSRLAMALGKDVAGAPVVEDLGRMPHLLIAGETGSGKSVCLNAIICSILFKSRPEEVRFLLIDPKRLELSYYEGIPHLIHPVITSPKEAALALDWAVREMQARYARMAEEGARDIEGYNRQRPAPERLPFLVVVIDELADLMMVSSRQVEGAIARLAQMARAAGIHLVVATQRPSVDVITGTIKVNFPARISFRLASRNDSRTVLDAAGAERLLGAGDMLFLPPGTSRLRRIHGAYLSGEEVRRVTDFLRSRGTPQYRSDLLRPPEQEPEGEEWEDEKYADAVRLVVETGQASISMLQRRLRVGYNRAARMIERMEREGIVSPSDGVRPREVLRR